MIKTNLAGEEVEIESNTRWRNNILEWLEEDSVSHPDLTNEEFLLEYAMGTLRYMPYPPSQHLTKYEWWPDLAMNLYELDEDTILGRMKITPNVQICNYRLQGIRLIVGLRHKLLEHEKN